ncbi:MAG: hypothetical protein K0B00_13775 [Rhodobacteraceae bacterium]|nr:hypothetical protein [Paracoccaceae bacterium]
MNSSTGRLSLAVAAALTAGPVLADADALGGYGHYGPGMMWGGGQWGGFGMLFGPILMILVLVGVVAGAIYLIRIFAPRAAGSVASSTEDRALAILRERLAKGEIELKEFEDRKRTLSS